MCVIVDTNLASSVFVANPSSDFLPIIEWLEGNNKDGHLVYGGKLAVELAKIASVGKYLVGLQKAGRAFLVPDAKLKELELSLQQSGLCKSNDHHIIALAQFTGTRTLCSHDVALHSDFTNHRLISKPRGKVYQNASHQKLLRHTPACPHRRQGKKK